MPDHAAPTDIVLVRHGEAKVNLEPFLYDTCHGLTDRGHDQARRLAARIADDPVRPTAVVHSPVLRCAQTAEHIATALGAARRAVPALRAPEHGEPGISTWDPAHNAIGTIPPLAPSAPPTAGAEPWQHFVERTGRALLDLAETHEGGRVVVVAHSETSAAALHVLLRLPLAAAAWAYPRMDHAALTVWTREPGVFAGSDPAGIWCLVSHNDTAHLPGEPGVAAGPDPDGDRRAESSFA